MTHSFTRVCTLSPKIVLGDLKQNLATALSYMNTLEKEKVAFALFPQLFLSGASCGDVFLSQGFQKEALAALKTLAAASGNMITILGLPLSVGGALYNVAVAVQNGEILGIVPKEDLPNAQRRWFSSCLPKTITTLSLFEKQVPFGSNLVFINEGFSFSLSLQEDDNLAMPPWTHGAHVLFHLRANPYILNSSQDINFLLRAFSKANSIASVHACSGRGESTTDRVFAGQCAIYERGDLLQEKKPFAPCSEILFADIDLSRLQYQQQKKGAYKTNDGNFIESNQVAFTPSFCANIQCRSYEPLPFLAQSQGLADQVREIFAIQSRGIETRMEKTAIKNLVLGVSGGLDSTLALLAAAHTLKHMALPLTHIHALIMPGFGSSSRTQTNAGKLASLLGCTTKEISIIPAVRQHFADIGHPEDLLNTTYENAQARERTQILMDYANQVQGLVLGTGNLSESALGFSTYNADHMSMYNPNCTIPKTLVKVAVALGGALLFGPEIGAVCEDIAATPVSPELLPTQKTEEILGSYDLHDFFLYHMMDSGSGYERLYTFAQLAFKDRFTPKEIEDTLTLFIRRFYQQQFKRSCSPDGPQVTNVSLSPRGGLALPSDLSPTPFLP